MRFYRWLLHLYPASLRIEYGDELASVFAARRAGASGVFGAAGTFFAALADVVPNAAAAHLDVLRQDLGYTARSLRRAPGFALTAVLVVALGVGANTAAFSVADFVLLRPLPFPHSDRLIKVWERTPGYGRMELSPPNYRDLKTAATTLSGFGAYSPGAANLVTAGEPRRVATAVVTHDLLSVVGVRPMMGRLFTPADTIASATIVISYDLWQTQLGGDGAAIGKRVDLDGRPYTVIGVMPSDFHFPSRDVAVWRTYHMAPEDAASRSNNDLAGVARLRDGVTLEQAQAELATIAARLEREYPQENEKTGTTVYRMSDELSDRTRLLIVALCGAALCTLLLACANLANLLLARAVGREREIAVRAALGAGRERLMRQLVTESLVLAAIGGTIGVVVAIMAVPAIARLVPSTLPIAQQPSVDLRVLAFAALSILVTGLAFGVFPAIRAGSPRALEALRDGARTLGGARQRVRSLLVMTEVMVSVALLISSGLLVRAMWRIQAVDPGFKTDGVLTLRTALPSPKYELVNARTQFYTRVLNDVRALPGVQSAAYTSFLPIAMGGGIWPVQIAGHEVIRDASNSASLRFVSPQFFATLRIPLLKGRDIAQTDDATQPFVAVVSQSFVKRYWPNEEPLGKRFQFGLHERTVVGVVGDIRVRGLEQASEPQVYVAPKQVGDSEVTFYSPKDLAIRSSLSAASLLPEIRRIVRAADPQQPISNVQSMEQIVVNETASRAAQLRVLGVLAAIALLLAGVGLHGLLSFTVSNRTREIGVRVALGAESSRIVRMVAREGVVLALGGLIPGVALAFWAGRAMQALLAGVKPNDPLTFAVAIALCGATVLFGCLRPAIRASRVDPAMALRAE
jgi:putative ABC transport system permease protein